jgi:hypothetical protein
MHQARVAGLLATRAIGGRWSTLDAWSGRNVSRCPPGQQPGHRAAGPTSNRMHVHGH